MRFASLGSGSEGNALIVEVGKTRVLMDCGFGLNETIERLARLEVEAESLDGILVTHEHSDHIGGVAKLARRFNIPVWLTFGTLSVCYDKFSAVERLCAIDAGECFVIGDMEVQSFVVPHDAREPAQYVFSDGEHRLGVLTDIGSSTPHVEEVLSGCDALVLECNHDTTMLMNSVYPYSLKQRISGRFGHLDNDQAATLLAALDCEKLQHLIAAHLSQQNNTPALARQALSQSLNCSLDWIGIADQAIGFDWRQIT